MFRRAWGWRSVPPVRPPWPTCSTMPTPPCTGRSRKVAGASGISTLPCTTRWSCAATSNSACHGRSKTTRCMSISTRSRRPGGQVVAFRAHIGWNHPRHGNVDNDTLAGAADSTGVAVSLTDWALDQTFAHLASWLTTASDPPRFVIVDLDGAVFTAAGFADRVVANLQQHRIDPRAVCFAARRRLHDQPHRRGQSGDRTAHRARRADRPRRRGRVGFGADLPPRAADRDHHPRHRGSPTTRNTPTMHSFVSSSTPPRGATASSWPPRSPPPNRATRSSRSVSTSSNMQHRRLVQAPTAMPTGAWHERAPRTMIR